MNRTFVIFLTVAVIVFMAFYAAKQYLQVDLISRKVISTIIPPSKDVKNYLPQGPDTLYSFNLPPASNMDVFADLKGEMPRVIIFDEYQNLLVSIPGKGKVIALNDNNGDRKADSNIEILTGLNKPHGLALSGNYLYVAETNGVSRYEYDAYNAAASGREQLFSLPANGRHATRTIKIYNDKLYTSVGSSCDVCVERNEFRASILVSNLDGSDLKVFASGLRNTVFFAFDKDGRMWGNDMGRDFLGDNLPPDELNVIDEGKNYGWPYCYGARNSDAKYRHDDIYYCNQTAPSAYDYPAHVAPLGILPMESGFLVAFHGSWNSSEPVGYKVVRIDKFAGEVVGMHDYIDGFIKGKREVLGRPVDLALDADDNLYISDDHAGVIYVLY